MFGEKDSYEILHARTSWRPQSGATHISIQAAKIVTGTQ